MARYAEYAKDELFDSLLYKEMAKRTKREENRKILEEMSKQEYWHYKFWSKYAGEVELTALDKLRLRIYLLMSKILGTVFTIKFLEKHEDEVLNEYKKIYEKRQVKEEDLKNLEKIIKEEEEHENYFISQIDEFAVRHLGSIALGMADAIIELTGVHAGFIGFTASSIITGIAGLIVGVSASMSMATAAYLQAKQEMGKQPFISAASTGIAYILTVIALTSPFFMNISLFWAFLASVFLALLILAFFSYYSSVIFERAFLKDYLENVGLIFIIVLISYYFGDFVKKIFGNIPI